MDIPAVNGFSNFVQPRSIVDIGLMGFLDHWSDSRENFVFWGVEGQTKVSVFENGIVASNRNDYLVRDFAAAYS